MKELLLGCGSQTKKFLWVDGKEKFENVVRLDINEAHNPDVLWDLRDHPLPFIDNEFDEIHAYEVLEHLAFQGEHEFFFNEFSEYARILKPGGLFIASVPALNSPWLWGDPSHKRVICEQTLIFLNQDNYLQIGETAMSDFRNIYKADFKLRFSKTENNFYKFILEVKK